jgi:hypothetical protein
MRERGELLASILVVHSSVRTIKQSTIARLVHEAWDDISSSFREPEKRVRQLVRKLEGG